MPEFYNLFVHSKGVNWVYYQRTTPHKRLWWARIAPAYTESHASAVFQGQLNRSRTISRIPYYVYVHMFPVDIYMSAVSGRSHIIRGKCVRLSETRENVTLLGGRLDRLRHHRCACGRACRVVTVNGAGSIVLLGGETHGFSSVRENMHFFHSR